MIFYTLSGPGHILEIHDDKLLLSKKGLRRLFSPKKRHQEYPLSELVSFEITMPKFIFWGRVEWMTSSGQKGSFSFTTNYKMMKMIERYMQKKIEKTQERKVIFKKGPAPGPSIAA